jgi:hypothetical protein
MPAGLPDRARNLIGVPRCVSCAMNNANRTASDRCCTLVRSTIRPLGKIASASLTAEENSTSWYRSGQETGSRSRGTPQMNQAPLASLRQKGARPAAEGVRFGPRGTSSPLAGRLPPPFASVQTTAWSDYRRRWKRTASRPRPGQRPPGTTEGDGPDWRAGCAGPRVRCLGFLGWGPCRDPGDADQRPEHGGPRAGVTTTPTRRVQEG